MNTTVAKYLNLLSNIEKKKSMHDLDVTVNLLRHPHENVRSKAREVTVALIRDSIIEDYNKIDFNSRKKLAQIIDTIKPEIIHELIKDIHSSDEEVRIHSLMILGLFRRRTNIKIELEKQLKSSNSRIKATAVQALGNYPDSAELLMLLRQLNDLDERVRANAVEALEKFDDTKLCFTIKRLIHDNNNRVRANALKALFKLGERDIGNEIEIMLYSKEPLMNASALWLISQISFFNVEILEKCREHYKSIDLMIRRNAKLALQKYMDEGKISSLEEDSESAQKNALYRNEESSTEEIVSAESEYGSITPLEKEEEPQNDSQEPNEPKQSTVIIRAEPILNQ